MSSHSLGSCIFCKIIKGEIPSMKLAETATSYAFLDIGPLSKGHSLVIPKYHAAKLHELPDEHLVDTLTLVKKVAIATGAKDYNILQNNGRAAHQVVDHVHFHIIPKPDEDAQSADGKGLGIDWPSMQIEQDELKKIFEAMKSRM